MVVVVGFGGIRGAVLVLVKEQEKAVPQPGTKRRGHVLSSPCCRRLGRVREEEMHKIRLPRCVQRSRPAGMVHTPSRV